MNFKIKSFKKLSLFLGVIFCCFPLKALCNEIILNEINPEEEFFELFNTSAENIDLSLWQFSELTSSGEEKIWDFSKYSQDLHIEGNGFFVLYFSRKLNDSGDFLKIFNAEKELIDGLEIPAKVSGKSLARNEENIFLWTDQSPGKENIFENNETETQDPGPDEENVEIQDSTPDEENEEIQDSAFDEENEETQNLTSVTETQNLAFLQEKIKIIEVCFAPEKEQKEFFRLQNLSETEISIKDWQFSELTSKGEEKFWDFSKYSEIDKILPQEIFTLEFSSKLNNDGDFLKIIDPYGQVISSMQVGTSSNSSESFSSSSSSSKSSTQIEEEVIKKLVSTRPLVASLSALNKDFTLEIIEVSLKNKQNDFIKVRFSYTNPFEVFSLAGIRLCTDNVDFEIPINTTCRHGDILIFHFQGSSAADKDPQKVVIHPGGTLWHFFVPKSGLVGTDETLFLLDSRENVFDAICWTNQDGKFSSGEEEDVKNLIENESLKGDVNNLQEEICFNSNLIESDFSLFRKFDPSFLQFIDSNQSSDFFAGSKNQDLLLLENYFSRQKVLFKEDVSFFAENIAPKKASEVDIALQEIIFFPGKKAMVSFSSWQDLNYFRHFAIFLNGHKQADFNNFTFDFSGIAKHGGRIDLKDAWGNNALSFTYNGNKQSFRFPANLWGKIKRRDKKTYSNRRVDFYFEVVTLKDIARSSSLTISEVLPNPFGKDKDQEFIEFFARSEVNLGFWRLFINEQEISLPFKHLSKGQFFTLFSQNFTLKNSQSELILMSTQSSEAFYLNWEKAKSNFSLAQKKVHFLKFNSQKENFIWTKQPTANKENIFTLEARKKKKTKQNQQEQKEQKTNKKKNIIQDLELFAALPNPKGRDKNKEKIFLKNISNQNGWIENWYLANNKKLKKIDPLFFKKNELKVIVAPFNLVNKSDYLQLLDNHKNIKNKISWIQAKEKKIYHLNVALDKVIKKNKLKTKKYAKNKKSKQKSKLSLYKKQKNTLKKLRSYQEKIFSQQNKKELKKFFISFKTDLKEIFSFLSFFESEKDLAEKHNHFIFLSTFFLFFVGILVFLFKP